MFPNILVTDARTQTELFDRVASHLTKIGYVTADYYQALVEREASFPTGLKIDLKDGSDILYAAIPHTETKHCLVNQVIYVKNSHPLAFQHMINPEETCFVTDFSLLSIVKMRVRRRFYPISLPSLLPRGILAI